MYTDETDKIFNKLVKAAPLLKSFNILTGERRPDAKPKNVMVTMILFRGMEDEKTDKFQGEDEH